MSRQHSRRRFLAGLGLSPALLPALPTERARAGCLDRSPRRAIFFNWCNGTSGGWPKDAALTLPSWMSPLEKHKAKLLVIDGVRYQNLRDTPNPDRADNVGHGAVPAMLTGHRYQRITHGVNIAGGPSVDHYIAAGLRRRGFDGVMGIRLGVNPQGFHHHWKAANQPLPVNRDPYAAFDTIFGGSAGGTNTAALRATRRSVLDHVRRDLGRFVAALDGEDRRRAEAHLEAVREIERQLVPKAPAAGCTPPKLDADRLDVKDPTNFEAVLRLQTDILVAALAADLTRVASLTIGNENGEGLTFPFLAAELQAVGAKPGHHQHTYAHEGGPGKEVVDRWHMRVAAQLLDKLQAAKEGDGTMLDGSVVLVANNMSTGGGHQIVGVRWLLAGGCGGVFKTGRLVTTNGVQHSRVLKTIAAAMEVDPAGFGDPAYGDELPDLRG